MDGISNLSRSVSGPYELNARQYGPVVATAIGAASAVGDAASATCSFSQECLDELASAAKTGYDTVSSALSSAEQTVEDAADSVGDALSSAADTAGEALSWVADGVSDLAGGIANYVGLGAAAVSQAISEVA